jgi:exodeoxyribonuclease-5
MELTRKQEEGLKIAMDRYKQKEAYTCIAGFAGTGKSTLVKFIIEELDVPNSKIAFCAYTGKAASVLAKKGNPGATTAHRLLYHTEELEDGTYIHTPRTSPEKDLKLIVVDEVSMLEKEQWEILMRWKIPVICLGDPAQLPPIHEDNGVLDTPHVFLDEVMRQAQDNEIIRLSMDVREGRYLTPRKGKDVWIVSDEDVTDRLLTTADIVLCGKNATRRDLNRRMRQAIWGDKYTDEPQNGDKCICLKNYWNEGDLTNGTIGILQYIRTYNTKLYKPKMVADFVSESDGYFENLHMDHQLFQTGLPTVNKDTWKKYPKHERPMEFDYANCITVHKSQGSEYDRVVVYNEYLGDRDYWRRWAYTAITRSKDKLVIVL